MASKETVKDQRSVAREKVRAMQEAQRRKERRQRSLIITSAVVVAALLVGLVVFAVTRAQANQPDLAKVVVPPGITSDGGITAKGPAGAADQPVTVVEYLDYQCPACKQFDIEAGSYLEQQVAEGVIEMEYHPVNFLDSASGGTRYSSRAGNAAYCVSANGGDIMTFSDTLYAEQPPEGGTGLPNEELVSAAQDAGASDEVEGCITSETYTGYVTQQNDRAFKKTGDGLDIGGTPAVYVSGEKVANASGGPPSVQDMQAAIQAAQR